MLLLCGDLSGKLPLNELCLCGPQCDTYQFVNLKRGGERGGVEDGERGGDGGEEGDGGWMDGGGWMGDGGGWMGGWMDGGWMGWGRGTKREEG